MGEIYRKGLSKKTNEAMDEILKEIDRLSQTEGDQNIKKEDILSLLKKMACYALPFHGRTGDPECRKAVQQSGRDQVDVQQADLRHQQKTLHGDRGRTCHGTGASLRRCDQLLCKRRDRLEQE